MSGRTSKHSYEERVVSVRKIIDGEISHFAMAKKLNIDGNTLLDWYVPTGTMAWLGVDILIKLNYWQFTIIWISAEGLLNAATITIYRAHLYYENGY